ncbi:hypothetical protein C8J36_103566 [Rhizobium sp. PP-F2F-G48]|uniref:hypothetical protein n=1 Tax=Rhizobium sp. PP-F2F-G48 TaxID=2135651 RepID=UPI00104CBBFC|nr:hypothetical protein [Rhizobium sp. PP-F2F-G48]TCM56194.1 hypothetical protein C8J36_103566 [Rhizobium sp. PP-F2F-G48]
MREAFRKIKQHFCRHTWEPQRKQHWIQNTCSKCGLHGPTHFRPLMRSEDDPTPQPNVTGQAVSIRDSHFGPYVAISMPTGCNMIVVFADKQQHVPVWLGLPHQLYVKTAKRLMSEHECRTLTLVPYRNEHKVELTSAALAATEGSNE